MTRPSRALPAVMALTGVLGLAACAAPSAGSAEIGRTASVAHGTIVSMRPVAALGTGDDPRADILGAVGGVVVGGLAGAAAERDAGRSAAAEFIIHEDNGHTISVVQNDESHFRPGDRVVLTRGARTRIARAFN